MYTSTAYAVTNMHAQLHYATHDSGGFYLPPLLVIVALGLAGFFLLSALARPRATIQVSQAPVVPAFLLFVIWVATVVILIRLLN